ncbi:hypothetical protein ACEPAI_9627 [Sanghuangporus weigelae]
MFSGLQRLWSRRDRRKDENDMLARRAEADKQKYGSGYTAATGIRIGDSQRRSAPVPAAESNAPPQPDAAAARPAVPVIPVHNAPEVVPLVIPSSVLDEILQQLRESRRAQSALLDQQRETIRHLRNLDEWMSRSVREREDDLQRLASNIEALGNELRDELGRRGFTTPETFSNGVRSTTSTRNQKESLAF